MPDLLETLIAAESQKLRAEDPYLRGSQQLGQINTFRPYRGVGTNLATALLSQLGAGVQQGIGQQRVDTRAGQFGSNLQSALAGDAAALAQSDIQRYAPQITGYQQQREDAIDDYTSKVMVRGTPSSGLSPQEQSALDDVRFNNSGELSKETKATLQQSPNVTFQRMIGNTLKQRQVSGRTGRRLDLAEEKFEINKGERVLKGYHPAYKGLVLSKQDASKARQRNQDVASLTDLYDRVASGVAEPGKITGTLGSINAATHAALFNRLRILTNSGARLEAREEALLLAMGPAMARGNALDYTKRQLLGEDSREFARVFSKLTRRARDVELAELGQLRTDVPLDHYPMATLASFAGIDSESGEAKNERVRSYLDQKYNDDESELLRIANMDSPTPEAAANAMKIMERLKPIRFVLGR